MTQHICAGLAVSLANFCKGIAEICKSCEVSQKLYRFRSYSPVTTFAQVSYENKEFLNLYSEKIEATAFASSPTMYVRVVTVFFASSSPN